MVCLKDQLNYVVMLLFVVSSGDQIERVVIIISGHDQRVLSHNAHNAIEQLK